MIKYKFTKYKINPPSHIPNYLDHDCREEGCWEKTNCCNGGCFTVCPFAIIQYCMICDEDAYVAYSLDFERRTTVTTIPFWVCDKHYYDEKLEEVLREGIPPIIAEDHEQLLEYVGKELEKKLV